MFDQKCLKEAIRTVSRRIDEISEWVENKLIKRVKLRRWFSLQLDESTDIQGLLQMIVFVRYMWMNEDFCAANRLFEVQVMTILTLLIPI